MPSGVPSTPGVPQRLAPRDHTRPAVTRETCWAGGAAARPSAVGRRDHGETPPDWRARHTARLRRKGPSVAPRCVALQVARPGCLLVHQIGLRPWSGPGRGWRKPRSVPSEPEGQSARRRAPGRTCPPPGIGDACTDGTGHVAFAGLPHVVESPTEDGRGQGRSPRRLPTRSFGGPGLCDLRRSP